MVNRTNRSIDRLYRRRFLRASAGLTSLGALTGEVAGRSGSGGNGGDGGGEGGGGGDGGSPPPSWPRDDDEPEGTVTLITGQTVRVTGTGRRRQYTVLDEQPDGYRLFEGENGTYVFPDDVDFDRFDRELFNVDALLRQGVGDEASDAIPVIVTLRADLQDRDASTASPSSTGFDPRAVIESINAVAGDVRKDETEVSAREFGSSDVVEKVHLDAQFEATLDSSSDVVAAAASRERYGVDGSGVSIAVVDTGIDADHPDLGDRVVHREDFSGDGVGDRAGHGTHVAGIAAGSGTASDDKYVGMAPGADLLDVKVLGDDGRGSLSSVAQGIEHAVEREADVINMSLGGSPNEDGLLRRVANNAVDEGTVVVAAAGNRGDYQSVGSPGVARKAITVGASWGADEIVFFSSRGPTEHEHFVKPEVAAPGVDVTSTGSEDAGDYPYTTLHGTSMAAPHVAGIAGLLVEDDPSQDPETVKESLVSTADRIDGADVYEQGAGVVDTEAALATDLIVRDPVVNLGLYVDDRTLTREIELENTGSQPVTVSTSASLVNFTPDSEKEPLPDSVSANPGTFTVDPGSVETVTVTVDTAVPWGFNSGVVTFETDAGAIRNAIFGFVRGIDVTVEKVLHERSNATPDDSITVLGPDGNYMHRGYRVFDEEHRYSFTLFRDPGTYTVWSDGTIDTPDGESTVCWTVAETEITPENNHVTLDEREVVPRELDTSRLDAELATPQVHARVYRNVDGGWPQFVDREHSGSDIVYYSPIEESDPTYLGTQWVLTAGEGASADHLDAPEVYNLFYGDTSVQPPVETVEIDPETLVEEQHDLTLTSEVESRRAAPHFWPVGKFEALVSLSTAFLVPIDRTEQTWYCNDRSLYDTHWFYYPNESARSFDTVYEQRRLALEQYEAGTTIRTTLNREPLLDRLRRWTLRDGTLTVDLGWYCDRSSEPRVTDNLDFPPETNTYSVSVNGSEVATEGSFFSNPQSTEVRNVSPGDLVELTSRGRLLVDNPRGSETNQQYSVTYEPGSPNTPPRIDDVAVTGLDDLNQVPASQIPVFVDLTHEADDVDEFEAHYAPSDAVDAAPSETAEGWHEARVVYRDKRGHRDGSTVGLLLDTTGHSGQVDLALRAVDTAGGTVRTWTTEAINVVEGAEAVAAIDVANVGNPESSKTVPVEITADGDVDPGSIDPDSLRFGDPRAVHAGDGASPERVERLGKGTLQAHFPADETGITDEDRPVVAAILTGQLDDGTGIAGGAVVRGGDVSKSAQRTPPDRVRRVP